MEITSKSYLSLSGSKSQGIKQLVAGGGIYLIGANVISKITFGAGTPGGGAVPTP